MFNKPDPLTTVFDSMMAERQQREQEEIQAQAFMSKQQEYESLGGFSGMFDFDPQSGSITPRELQVGEEINGFVYVGGNPDEESSYINKEEIDDNNVFTGALDLGIGVASGAISSAEAVSKFFDRGQITDTLTNFVERDGAVADVGDNENFVSAGLRLLRDKIEEGYSDERKLEKLQLDLDLANADGFGEEAMAVLKSAASNPLNTTAEIVGMMAAPGGLAKMVSGGSKVVSTLANATFGGMMGGGEAGSSAYDIVKNTDVAKLAEDERFKALINSGKTTEEAVEELARTAQNDARAIGFAIGALSGATGAEKLLSKGAPKNVAGDIVDGVTVPRKSVIKEAGKLGAFEATSEALEEGATTLTGNVIGGQYDADFDTTKGLGSAVAGGAIFGGPFGAIAGAGDALANNAYQEIRDGKAFIDSKLKRNEKETALNRLDSVGEVATAESPIDKATENMQSVTTEKVRPEPVLKIDGLVAKPVGPGRKLSEDYLRGGTKSQNLQDLLDNDEVYAENKEFGLVSDSQDIATSAVQAEPAESKPMSIEEIDAFLGSGKEAGLTRENVEKPLSMFEYLAVNGGLNIDEVTSSFSVDPEAAKDFGKGVKKAFNKNGMSTDSAVELLTQAGFLTSDKNGNGDIRELEEKIFAELSGDKQYAGDDVVAAAQFDIEQSLPPKNFKRLNEDEVYGKDVAEAIDSLNTRVDGEGNQLNLNKDNLLVARTEDKTLGALEKVFNVQIVEIAETEDSGAEKYNGASFNGFYKNGKIFINRATTDKMISVASHELFHSIERLSPKLAKEATDAVKQYRNSDAWASYRKDLIDSGYKESEVDSENAADVFGLYMADPKFLQNLVQKSPSAFARLKSVIKSTVKKLAKYAGADPYIKNLISDYDALSVNMEKVATEYAKQRQAGNEKDGLVINPEPTEYAPVSWASFDKVDASANIIQKDTMGNGLSEASDPVTDSANLVSRDSKFDLVSEQDADIPGFDAADNNDLFRYDKDDEIPFSLPKMTRGEKLKKLKKEDKAQKEKNLKATRNSDELISENVQTDINRALSGTKAVGGRQIKLESENQVGRFLKTIVNKYDRVGDVVDLVKKVAGNEAVKFLKGIDPFKELELYEGRVTGELQDYKTEELEPFVKRVKESGFSVNDVGLMAYAEHAEERNNSIARKSNGEFQNGSGMDAYTAQQIKSGKAVTWKFKDREGNDDSMQISARTPGELAKLKSLTAELRAMNDRNLDLLVESGLETQETVDALRASYKFYVRLPTIEDASEKFDLGNVTGISVRGSTVKEAVGRSVPAEMIVESNLLARERLLKRAIKNKVAVSFAEFAIESSVAGYMPTTESGEPVFELNPMGEIRSFFREGSINDYRAEAFKFYSETNPGFLMDRAEPVKKDSQLTEEDLVKFISSQYNVPADVEAINRMAARRKGTLDVERMQPNKNQIMIARVAGKDVAIKINDQYLAKTLLEQTKSEPHVIRKVFSGYASYLRRLYTGWSPAFWVVSLSRDVLQTGLMSLAAGDSNLAMSYIKNLPSAMRESFQYGKLEAGLNGKESADFNRYRKSGARTGYIIETKDVDELSELINSINDPKTKREKLLRAGAKTAKVMDSFGSAFEDSARLALFKAMKQSGQYSERDLAAKMKELTVNYNRKGELTGLLSDLYLFFNSSVQGTYTLAKGFSNKRVLKASSAFIAAHTSMAIASALMMGEDEDGEALWNNPSVRDDRRSHWIIPTGGKDYIKIPFPYGMDSLLSPGNIAASIFASTAIGGDVKRESFKELASAVSTAIKGLTPVPVGTMAQVLEGGADIPEAVLLGLTPSEPLRQMAVSATGTSTFGSSIAPTSFGGTDNESMFKSTRGSVFDSTAGVLAESFGGSRANPTIDVSPETLKYLYRSNTGFVGQIFSSIADLTSFALGEKTVEDMGIKDIPFVGRFGSGDETVRRGNVEKFYERIDQVETATAEAKSLPNEERAKYREENPESRLARVAGRFKKQVGEMRKKVSEINNSERFTEKEKALKIRALEKKIEEQVNKFNSKFSEKVGG